MKYIQFIVLAFLTVSCESTLDLTPLSQNNVNSFYNTESDLEQAVVATYDGVQEIMQAGYLDHFGEVRSDNTYNFATTPAGGAYADFDNFNLTSSNNRLNAYWHNAYLGIQRANIVLSRIDGVDMDDQRREIRKGEVKFLRALQYLYLVQIWGDVPLVLEETEDAISFIGQTRNPKQEVYDQIIKDLAEAAAVLPETIGAEDDGRASKGAANGLLARTYLTLGNYEKVLEYVNKVISSGVYSLDPDYGAIFDYGHKSDEVIFKVLFKSGTNSEGFSFPNVNHDYNNTAARDFMETFKDDARLDAVVDTSLIGTYYSNKIYNENVNSSDNTIDIKIVVLRYSDILLMKAEALNANQYPDQEAFDLLNMVHTRQVGNAPIQQGEIGSKDAFLDAVLNERRIEFSFENQRWFDLVRTGKAQAVMQSKNVGGDKPNSASALPFTFKETDLLFPIPQPQIDASGGSLEQNPGY